MSPFAPSVHAAARSLGAGAKIVTRDHPVGSKGASLSLDEVAQRIREGRLDPRVRAWAGKVLIAAGRPKDAKGQAQAILDEFKAKTVSVDDPVGSEMIVAAKNTLCLAEGELCMPSMDCDDGVVALGSVLMSIGIPVKVIGQSFDISGVPTHVILAFDSGIYGWLKIDPRYGTKVGEAANATSEVWIDPLDAKHMTTLSGQPKGDYVGVGHVRETPMFDPWVHAMGVAGRRVGVGAGLVITADDITVALRQTDATAANIDAAVNACSTIDPLTKTQWKTFFAAYQAFSAANKNLNFFTLGLPNIGDQVVAYEGQLNQWNTTIGKVCVNPQPDPGTPHSPGSGLDAGTKLLIGLGVTVVGLVVLYPMISEAAAALKARRLARGMGEPEPEYLTPAARRLSR